jgi:hypothetical protein
LVASQPETRKKRKFRFKNPLLSLDATVIDLCATMFDWAKFRLGTGGGYGRGDLQGTLADRVVFSGLKTVTARENVCGDFSQCLENAALDGAHRHAVGEISAAAIDVRLVPFQSGSTPTTAVVCLP